MKIFFGIFSLLIFTIEVQGSTKIEIFEIRDNDDGLEIKNLNSNQRHIKKPDPIIKLLRRPKSEKPAKLESKGIKFVKQLLSKLKSLKGDTKMNKFNNDARIYILSAYDFDSKSTHEDTYFFDKTRDDLDRGTNNIDTNDIQDALLRLLQKPDGKKPIERKQRKLRHNKLVRLRKPVLRADSNEVIDKTKPRHLYEYDEIMMA